MVIAVDEVRRVAGDTLDPEVPALTIAELGILRDVRVGPSGHIDIDITPTYSGCPALEAIEADVARRVREHGYSNVTVHVVRAPAWTTDWISDAGRRKLRDHGIAPPRPRAGLKLLELAVACPVCGSTRTEEIAHFGSTACQAMRRCVMCGEPFQHFKEH